jgi:hypothetical protein
MKNKLMTVVIKGDEQEIAASIVFNKGVPSLKVFEYTKVLIQAMMEISYKIGQAHGLSNSQVDDEIFK